MTCRRFTPAEAKAAGSANRVVPAAELEAEAEAWRARCAATPSVPVIDHQGARQRRHAFDGRGSTAFADGDALLGACSHPSH